MKSRPQGKVASNASDVVLRLPEACRDERAAVEFMEEQRWGSEPSCARCGVVGECYQMRDRKTGERSSRYLWRCRACKKQYTVRVGTVLEDSPIPLRVWCHAFWRASSSKKGVSALQIKRETGLSYKSALFMMHRIRFAMATPPGQARPLTGTVEADETYFGGKPRRRNYGKTGERREKACIVAMVERGGEIRPKHVEPEGVNWTVYKNVSPEARLVTDESSLYIGIGKTYQGGHHTVKHKAYEYARVTADAVIHTNTVEGFFSLLKRGLHGTFHSVSRKHLHRYLSEFEYRYNTRSMEDGARTVQAIKSAEGKRLKYREQVEG